MIYLYTSIQKIDYDIFVKKMEDDVKGRNFKKPGFLFRILVLSNSFIL